MLLSVWYATLIFENVSLSPPVSGWCWSESFLNRLVITQSGSSGLTPRSRAASDCVSSVIVLRLYRLGLAMSEEQETTGGDHHKPYPGLELHFGALGLVGSKAFVAEVSFW